MHILLQRTGLKTYAHGKSVLPWVKNVGKPYAGKPHVRFDEEGLGSPALYSTECGNIKNRLSIINQLTLLRKSMIYLHGWSVRYY